jgi:hypothetical protein
MDYAAKITEALLDDGIRAELDERNEKIGYKIRYARQEDKVPYMLIIGEKEIAEKYVVSTAQAAAIRKLFSMPRGILMEASFHAFFRLSSRWVLNQGVKPACSSALEREALMIII